MARPLPAGKVENGIISGLDLFPTFVAAAANPDIAEELKKGKQPGDATYKVHFDGYNQMDLITGRGHHACVKKGTSRKQSSATSGNCKP
jgi:arylsulfatase